MHRLSYKLSDTTEYIVHHDGDCTGNAIFIIVKNDQKTSEEHADISDIQDNVLMAQILNADSIRIGKTDFLLEGIVFILSSLSIMRLTYVLESKEISLEDLVDLEDSINDL